MTRGANLLTLAMGIAGFFFVSHRVPAQQIVNSESQEKPSLSETEKWIEQTFGDGSHIVHKGFQRISFVSVDDDLCYLSLMVTEQAGHAVRFTEIVDLAAVDPNSIKASELIHDSDITTVTDPNGVDYSTWAVKDHPYVYVSVRTTNNDDVVISNTAFDHQTIKESYHELGFPGEGLALNPEYSSRFIKALRHAVKLCGGRPSAF